MAVDRDRTRSRRAFLAAAALVFASGCGSGTGGATDGSTTTSGSNPTTTSEPVATTVTSVTTTAPSPTTAPGNSTLPEPVPTTGSTPSGPAVQIRRGDPDRRVVALTFDAGSDVGYTTTILDTLLASDIRATFGVTGAWAEDHPDLVRRIASEGHQVLNHSYDHPSFTGVSTGLAPLTRAERAEQLARAEAVLVGLGAGARPWFRPPYGDVDASVDADLAASGYRWNVLWTVDSLGWKGIPTDEIVDRCLDGAVPGAIFLFHVGSASADADALPAVIDGLRDQGYTFDTVAAIVT